MGSTSLFRRRLALTTILTVAPFFGYGRQAFAACDPTPSPTFLCSGANVVTQTITADNADVSTAPGFDVNAPAGNGIIITGDGHLRFTDNNASTIIGDANGLSLRATGDAGAAEGAITITTNSNITGGDFGIHARSDGRGEITIIANGGVTGTTYDGITAYNSAIGTDVTIRTGAGSNVSGQSSGIDGDNLGTGDLVITADGRISGTRVDGISASVGSNGRDLTITTGAASDVSGYRNGIDARSSGSGDLAITANGKITGTHVQSHGIFASNTASGENLAITTGAASEITGDFMGIRGRHEGSGDLTITANGEVSGTVREGIYALTLAGSSNLTVTTGAGSVVTGGYDGIEARSLGDGALAVTANGEVTGAIENGIWVVNYSGSSATVTTGAQSKVSGYDGIGGRNDSGDFTIIANGEVTGLDRHGIDALNTSGAENLKITTGVGSTVTGYSDGIRARNEGDGDLEVIVHGKVSGEGRYGIEASSSANGDNLIITTAAGSEVTGSIHGIRGGRNYGSGDLIITADGKVTGRQADGISADNRSSAVNLTVKTGTASAIIGYSNGINANNSGSGDLTITAYGVVEGTTRNGITAFNSGNSKNLTITTGAGSDVKGADDAIVARNSGSGTLAITVDGDATGTIGNGIRAYNSAGASLLISVGATGLVQGLEAGIYANSSLGQDIAITIDGAVRNITGATTGLAIRAAGGPASIDNNGQLIGTLALSASADTLNNKGLWRTGGSSDFGSATDSVNNRGLFVAASGLSAIESSFLDNLEFFNNSGAVSLVDGLEGDQLGMGPATEFVGTGGRLIVDAFLAPGMPGKSDVLLINGNTSGTTNLVVNLTNPIGSAPNTDGIRVVSVSGNSLEQDFNIEGGVLNAGFFAWDLRRVEEGGDVVHELYTTGLGAGAHEFAAGITGAQDIWHQSTGTLLQRQADLRSLLSATQVTPVADFSEPVAPTPAGSVTPGLWFKGVGAYLQRDASDGALTLDRDQTLFGFLAGVDFGTENLRDQSDALMFGLFGGYLTSDLDFKSTNTEWTYEGPSLGVYATYLDEAFYADIVVKADFLSVEIDADDLAPDADGADTDVFNIGGLIDAGYKIGLDRGLFVEPQAGLAVVHTEIDDIGDIFGGAVEFEDATSVRGRLGVRLGHELTAGSGLIYSSDVTASLWQEFAGDNEATIFAPLFPVTGVTDDPSETFGDVALGFSVQSPDGWSGFLRGNFQFAENYDAFGANAGLRYAW